MKGLSPFSWLASPDTTRRFAFTLVELLVVMVIILIIAGVTLPALKGTFNGINLTGASDVVIGQLLFARQAAISGNVPVEVRIYNTNTSGVPANATWNTIASVIPSYVSGRNINQWLEAPHTLTGSVIMDPAISASGDSFSTLVAQGLNNTTAPSASVPTPPSPWVPPWTAKELPGSPGPIAGLTYVAFRFQPDGSTNLPAGAWSLTLRNANIPPSTDKSVPASNYVAVVLDSLNGRSTTYRP